MEISHRGGPSGVEKIGAFCGRDAGPARVSLREGVHHYSAWHIRQQVRSAFSLVRNSGPSSRSSGISLSAVSTCADRSSVNIRSRKSI